MRLTEGEDRRTREWLEGIKANEPKFYEKNTPVVEAVASGEIDVGFVNHCYLYLVQEEDPDAPIANDFLSGDDPGALVNVAGAGIVSATDDGDAAERYSSSTLGGRPAVLRRGGGGGGVPARRGDRATRRATGARRLEGRPVAGRPRRRARVDPRAAERARLHELVGRGRPPLLLTALAVATVALVLLPLAYLVLRAGGGVDAWEVLTRRGTARLVVDTALLVSACVAGSAGGRVNSPGSSPDRPPRARIWAVAAALPLVIPELRRRARAPRRVRAAWDPAGGARGGLRRRAPPGDLRLPGRVPRARSLPTRTCSCSSRPPSAGSTHGARGGLARARADAMADVSRGDPAGRAAGDQRGLASRRALRAGRLPAPSP